jgi:hypothetical protein
MAKPTPFQAVMWGHAFVTLPVFATIITGGAVGLWLGGRLGPLFGLVGLLVGIVLGAAVAWVWWSFTVPVWRDWVVDQGLTPSDVQELAVATGLVWPRGSHFERTEFPRRGGRRGW